MTYKEIHAMSEADLNKTLAAAREELRDLRFKISANQLKQVHKVALVRQTISRIGTRLRALKNERV